MDSSELSEVYNLEKCTFGSELSLDIYCRSQAAHYEAVRSTSRQLDGTGFRTSPAGRLLCWFILSHHVILKERDVVELGCGHGLTGLAAASIAGRLAFKPLVLLTDGEADVLELVAHNIARNGLKARVKPLFLEWGKGVGPVTEARNAHGTAGRPILVLGSDLIYYASAVASLFHTLADLLRSSPACQEMGRGESLHPSLAIISFTPRWSMWGQEIEEASQRHSLQIRFIKHEEALQTSEAISDGSNGRFANTRLMVIFRPEDKEAVESFISSSSLLTLDEHEGDDNDILPLVTE